MMEHDGPNQRRPAYGGYFNALVAPVTALPIPPKATSYAAVFAASGAAALLQIAAVACAGWRKLGTHDR